MKVVILSTETPHHTFFINKISKKFEVAAVFYETKHVTPQFDVAPFFDEEELNFEIQYFFQTISNQIDRSLPVHIVQTVNEEGVGDQIKAYGVDIGLVFGCGKIKSHLFNATKMGLINVHRGISEEYRGLDSDLWAINKGDLKNVGVTIHKVAADLDTGEILRTSYLPLVDRAEIYHIRYYTTIMATHMVMDVLTEYQSTGQMKSRPQKKGNYYSFMPLETKLQTKKKFDATYQKKTSFAPQYYPSLFNFNQRIDDELAILLYHGVTNTESRGIENNSQKHLAVDEFHRQMEHISQNCHLLSMQEVSEYCRDKKPFPRKSVAVTFDDSFENVHRVAFPILKEFNIPFTFYLTTSFIESDDMFWVDMIEDCINRSEVDEIKVPYIDDTFFLRSLKDKLHALSMIKGYCKRTNKSEKDEIIEALKATTKVMPCVDVSPNYKKITWQQVREITEYPNGIVGGHTHTHNIMSQMPEDVLIDEIETSLKLLEQNIGQKIKHYSYPEGQGHHYNEGVIAHLKKRGVVCCPSAIVGLNSPLVDPFYLRRIMVGFMGMPFPYFDENLNLAFQKN